MSDTTDKPKLGARAPLGLKRTVETGKVKQSFSHGRSNTVVVEVKKRRILGPGGAAPEAPKVEEAPPPAAAAPAAPAAPPAPQPPRRSARPPQRPMDASARRELQEKLLREAEEARLSSLEEARRREDRQALAATEDERRRADENRKAEEEARVRAEREPEDAARSAEPPLRRRRRRAAAPRLPWATTKTSAAAPPRQAGRCAPSARAARPVRGRDDRRHAGKLTVTRALSGDEDSNRARSLAALRRAREKEKRSHSQAGPSAKQVRDVVVPDTITVGELANRMAERAADLVKSLFKMGMVVTVNQAIDQDTAELLVTEFGHNIKRVSESDVEIGIGGDDDAAETRLPRPPVVTIMGHVDHGKTSLLDAIRGANVVSGEAGGITQHIGAYQVAIPDGSKITFLDTPGHEAFSEMRARGANVTDIVVLVVAADDGLKPQTVEAINHTKAAGVPMIVAINKIDKEGARPQTVREELLPARDRRRGSWAATCRTSKSPRSRRPTSKACSKRSTFRRKSSSCRANPDRPAEGAVVEAKLDKGRGPLATVLVQRGTLRVGDIFVVGAIRQGPAR
jgi:translation initiation factor IF-2